MSSASPRQVASVQGVWRVLAADARGGRTVGLSTSRAIGDLALKKPKALVVSNPTVHVYTLHFEHDAFLVRFKSAAVLPASDGGRGCVHLRSTWATHLAL